MGMRMMVQGHYQKQPNKSTGFMLAGLGVGLRLRGLNPRHPLQGSRSPHRCSLANMTI